jgi:hypothetical protein
MSYFSNFSTFSRISKINFENKINVIISQEKFFEEKLDAIIRDLKKFLASCTKLMNENSLKQEKKQKKKLKFVYNIH